VAAEGSEEVEGRFRLVLFAHGSREDDWFDFVEDLRSRLREEKQGDLVVA
jgi:sirohydrochlorin ferrochelatase